LHSNMASSSDEEIEYELEDFSLCGEALSITTVAIMPLSVLVRLGGAVEVSGQKLWCGSVCLSEYLALSDFAQIAGAEVVELGAGTGAAGMLCSRRGAAKVWLTDHDQRCIEHMNKDCITNSISGAEVLRFDWLAPSMDLFAARGGLQTSGDASTRLTLIAGDVLYKSFLVEPFFKSVALLLSTRAGSVLYLCHIPRAGVEHDIVVAGAEAQGLDVTRCPDDFRERVRPELCPVDDVNRAHCYEIRRREGPAAGAADSSPSPSCPFGRISIAAVTPFLPPSESDLAGTTQQAIDERCFTESVAYLAAGLAAARRKLSAPQAQDVGGIIVCGTTGEQHSLGPEEKAGLFGLALAAAAPFGVDVFAGVAACTTYGAVQLALQAVSAGCRGLMLGLPPYVKPSDAELTAYVEAVYSAVPATCPILLYNNVTRNGCGPSLETLVSWARRGLVCGIKHANAPAGVLLQEGRAMLGMLPSLRLYTGSDTLAGSLLSGEGPGEGACEGAGVIAGEEGMPRFYGLTSIVGNLFPEETALAATGLARGRGGAGAGREHPLSLEAAHALHARLSRVCAACLGASLPVGLKYAMRRRSAGGEARLGGWPRLPLAALGAEHMAEVDQALALFTEEQK
jgi:dihydrodipicolinate synthase/N-acetylneuraminate lyase/predicted nicotinamide N-methyase